MPLRAVLITMYILDANRRQDNHILTRRCKIIQNCFHYLGILIFLARNSFDIHVYAMTEDMRVMDNEIYENKGWIRTCQLDQVLTYF